MTVTATGPRTIGRVRETEVLREAIGDLRRGQGGCVILEGPDGIGKSHLLAAAVHHAAELDVRVLDAGAATGRPAVGATRLGELCDTSTRDLPLRTPADAFAAPDAYARRWAERAGAFVRAQGPLLIVLDDAHRAAETAGLLGTLVPRTAGLPVLWLLVRRTGLPAGAADDALDHLAHDHARRVLIGPLDEPDTLQLATEVLGAPPEPRLAVLALRSGGFPGLLTALLTALREQGAVQIRGDRASVRNGELPRAVHRRVDAQLRVLSEETRWLLAAIAVYDRPCTLHEVVGLLGHGFDLRLASLVHEALAAQILTESEAGLAFRCPLVRDVVYENLSTSVRRALHREAASVLEQESGRPPAETARHIMLGTRPGEESAGRLRDFVAQLGRSPAALGESVRALEEVDRYGEARALVNDVLGAAELDPAARSGILVALSGAALNTGQDHGTAGHASDALRAPGLAPGLRARLLSVHASGQLAYGRDELAEEMAREAIRQGADSRDTEARVLGAMTLSRLALERGRLREASFRACEAVHLAHLGGIDTLHPQLLLAPARAALDDFEQAEIMLHLGERDAEKSGNTWLRPAWAYQRARLWLAAGRLDEAERAADAARESAEPRSPLGVRVLATLSHLALLRDDLSTAWYHLRRAGLGPVENLPSRPEDVLWRHGLLRLAEGGPETAFATLRPVYDALPRRTALLSREPQAAAVLVRVARCAGEGECARTVVHAIRELAAQHPEIPSLQGAAAHAEGVLRDDPQLLERANAAYRHAPRPLARAAALEDTGLLLRGVRPTRATARLRAALNLYEETGARWHARRVRRWLDAGPDASPGGPPPGPGLGWGTLTESERRVAVLVAEGLTNREVAKRLHISPHTVDSHLRHCFAKLAVNNRVALTRTVLDHHRPDPGNT
ncbi:LuxR C-terminal-related transcriptional regulator [Streptomyces sp. NPDC003077]|uniref:helix-turn-helix transcriptional regulator n=1 Tax=Streptomyces sp. NPDC003077 TaxID=3154443 RepID=UPI0033AA3F3C